MGLFTACKYGKRFLAEPLGWRRRKLFFWRRGEIPAIVYKYNLASGEKQEWLRLAPKDMTGVCQIAAIKLTPDGKTYAYSYVSDLSDLYVIENLG